MRYLLVIIVACALILRLININQSYWLDEGISVNAAKNLSFAQIITTFSTGDFHPPLYYLLLKLIINTLGDSELVSRSISVISGVLTVLVVYKLAKNLYENQTAIVASALVATSPLLIYYSQEARMYSIATLFSTGSLYFFTRLLKDDKIIYWAGFIISSVLAFYLDYMPLLIIPAYLLLLISAKRKYKRFTVKTFFPAVILIFAILLPWLNIFVKQLLAGLNLRNTTPTWEAIIGSSSVRDLAILIPKFIIGRISPENNLTYFLTFVPIGLFIIALLVISAIRLNFQRLSLWFFVAVPILLSFAISFFLPIFSYFRLIFVLPALYILLASAICNLNWSKPKNFMLTLMLMINLFSTAIYFFNPKFQREDWKSATAFAAQKSNKDTIVLFESNFTIPTFDIYNKENIKAHGALDSFSPDEEKVKENVSNLTSNYQTVLLFQYLAPISDPQGYVFNSLINNNFRNVETKDFRGVGFVYVFER